MSLVAALFPGSPMKVRSESVNLSAEHTTTTAVEDLHGTETNIPRSVDNTSLISVTEIDLNALSSYMAIIAYAAGYCACSTQLQHLPERLGEREQTRKEDGDNMHSFSSTWIKFVKSLLPFVGTIVMQAGSL